MTVTDDVWRVFLYALATAVATGFGALPFAFVRDLSPRAMALANAGAAGLMLGASIGLLAEGESVDPGATFVGALLGVGFVRLTQALLGDREPEFGALRGAGARRVLLVLVVMTVHSFAEGVAVGVSFGGGEALATAITVAIAVHNVPEGLAIGAVLRPQGASVLACAGWAVFSSLPQPVMAVPAYLFVRQFAALLPYGLGFAAGAMVFLVLEELLPEAYAHEGAPRIALVAVVSTTAMLLFQQLLG
ncbi:ZIP family metal transporter [Roseisolibacter sp. H3M3-2]|uniref:ZIP family metal transporter n=1 Tax=Roseisolibacter sp. H3M3-2 TaxID=3031323 RepID=UPI0023DA41E6|nr:ZIP family metal transporter [Roseisolibacter sp. H3M3-2]MDF1505794.1 ZIP family metal transporter [Roseisolibacter sp. H3M3-2]